MGASASVRVCKVGGMKTCDHCGKPTRHFVPVMTAAPAAASLADGSQPLPRLALYALGAPEPPWGEHPNDNDIQSWCEACAWRTRL